MSRLLYRKFCILNGQKNFVENVRISIDKYTFKY